MYVFQLCRSFLELASRRRDIGLQSWGTWGKKQKRNNRFPPSRLFAFFLFSPSARPARCNAARRSRLGDRKAY
jgi:hypothetical protein